MTEEEAIEQIASWTIWDIGDHIRRQLGFFSFQTFGDWKNHCLRCRICRAARERLSELEAEIPADETPIQSVIETFTAKAAPGSWEELQNYMNS